MLPDVRLGFAMRGEPKVNFFTRKLPDLAPVLNKLMQLKHVADEHRY